MLKKELGLDLVALDVDLKHMKCVNDGELLHYGVLSGVTILKTGGGYTDSGFVPCRAASSVPVNA